MLLILLSAAALAEPRPFGPAMSDGELAGFTAAPPPSAPGPVTFDSRPAATPVWEQLDNWWADDGTRLLAAARPVPVPPSGLDLTALGSGRFAVRLDMTITATNR